jgi:hypothetical protein
MPPFTAITIDHASAVTDDETIATLQARVAGKVSFPGTGLRAQRSVERCGAHDAPRRDRRLRCRRRSGSGAFRRRASSAGRRAAHGSRRRGHRRERHPAHPHRPARQAGDRSAGACGADRRRPGLAGRDRRRRGARPGPAGRLRPGSLAPLRAVATPLIDTVGPMPYAAIGAIHADPVVYSTDVDRLMPHYGLIAERLAPDQVRSAPARSVPPMAIHRCERLGLALSPAAAEQSHPLRGGRADDRRPGRPAPHSRCARSWRPAPSKASATRSGSTPGPSAPCRPRREPAGRHDRG